MDDDSLLSEKNQYFSIEWFSDWEGYGCVASRDIDKHTLINTEEPSLKGNQVTRALDNHINGAHSSQIDDRDYLKTECGKSDDEIDRLWQLHDQYMPRYKDRTQKRLWGIISSNAFSNQEKDFQKRVYLNTSRFNHSCSPNLGYDFDDWKIRVYTLRDIKAGDTLCISYSDVIYFFPRETRRLYLLGALGFECSCASCWDIQNSTVSDSNRRRLKQIAVELKNRVSSTLYSSEFCLHVNETAQRMAAKKQVIEEFPHIIIDEEKTSRREQLLERVRLRKLNKSIPIGQHDIDLIVEYITIAEKENVDFDMLPVFKLAYDITCMKVDVAALNPPKEYWEERYLKLLLCAKGLNRIALDLIITE